MYPAVPTAVAVTEDGLHLLVYSDTHIDVFDVHSGDWVQVREEEALLTYEQIYFHLISALDHSLQTNFLISSTN